MVDESLHADAFQARYLKPEKLTRGQCQDPICELQVHPPQPAHISSLNEYTKHLFMPTINQDDVDATNAAVAPNNYTLSLHPYNASRLVSKAAELDKCIGPFISK